MMHLKPQSRGSVLQKILLRDVHNSQNFSILGTVTVNAEVRNDLLEHTSRDHLDVEISFDGDTAHLSLASRCKLFLSLSLVEFGSRHRRGDGQRKAHRRNALAVA
jgi:hypothetical protein